MRGRLRQTQSIGEKRGISLRTTKRSPGKRRKSTQGHRGVVVVVEVVVHQFAVLVVVGGCVDGWVVGGGVGVTISLALVLVLSAGWKAALPRP